MTQPGPGPVPPTKVGREPSAAYIERLEEVPGWLSSIDATLLVRIAADLSCLGVAGDLLEIGVYKGRTAILLGYLVGPGERLLLCDVFEGAHDLEPGNVLDNARWYEGLDRRDFLANYRRFHDLEPDLLTVPSDELPELIRPSSMRLIHLDGAHDYPTVARDLRVCLGLLAPGGVLVVDDYVKAHLPGVGAAVWQIVWETDDLEIVAFSDDKLYLAYRSTDIAALRQGLTEEVEGHLGWRADAHKVGTAVVPRLVPRTAPTPMWNQS